MINVVCDIGLIFFSLFYVVFFSTILFNSFIFLEGKECVKSLIGISLTALLLGGMLVFLWKDFEFPVISIETLLNFVFMDNF